MFQLTFEEGREVESLRSQFVTLKRGQQNEQGQKIEAVFETIQHLIEAPVGDAKKRFGFPTLKDRAVVLE